MRIIELTNLQKIATSFVAFFMLIPGLAKFIPKFHNLFDSQIELSQMPFPELSFFLGQWSEIIVGFVLWGTLIFWHQLPKPFGSKLFILANLATLPIMAVAVYVHLHPDVPAEILPFEHKPALLPGLTIVAAIYNIVTTIKSLCSKCN